MLFGLGAYGIWGAFPIVFRQVENASAVEVLAHRTIWSLLLCLIFLAVLRQKFPTAVFKCRRSLWLMSCAAVLIAANWTVYVYGVNTDRVVETALGYYLNPLLSIGLGVLVLGERLRRLQWTAVGLGAVAVGVLSWSAGTIPWIAMSLAGLFALYGLLKKHVGGSVSALAGLTTETVLLLPLAVVIMWFFQHQGTMAFGSGDVRTSVMLVVVGAFTAIPLLCFAAAAARLPLSMMGMMQYMTPTIQFLIGVLLFGEQMSPSRWIGFGIVWLALTLIAIDGVRLGRTKQRG